MAKCAGQQTNKQPTTWGAQAPQEGDRDMDTMTTQAQRAANPLHPRMYQKVRLQCSGTDGLVIEGASYDSNYWYGSFMGMLASVNFTGEIEWTYEHTENNYCLALRNLSHVDSAVHIITTIALELSANNSWMQFFKESFGETVAQTLLRDAYMKDVDYNFDGVIKRGWQLVFPNIDTSLVNSVRNMVPRSLSQYNGSMEQF